MKKKRLARFLKTVFCTILILIGLTIVAAIVVANMTHLELKEIDLEDLMELKDVRSREDLENWYYGEMGDIAVGEAVVVESVSYDNYAYQQLDEETQVVYDQCLNCILNMDEKVTISTTNLDVLTLAYEAISADYGSLFWVNGYKYNTYTTNDKIIGLEFEPKYTMTKDQKEVYQAAVDAKCDQWLSGISQDASDYDKALFVFETLINNVDYDLSSDENQNILSVFLYGSTVCQGYADAAWYMLDKLGVNSTIITGKANDESHAWNLVYLDGAYYFMDVTWGNSKYLDLDNSEAKRINYAYLAMTTEELCSTHTIDMAIEIPECLSNADNYFVHNGLYFDTMDQDSIGWTFEKSYNAGEDEISIKLANADLFTQVSQYFFDERHISDYCRGLSSIYYLTDENVNVITIQW